MATRLQPAAPGGRSLLGISDDGWETEASEEFRARPEYGMLMALGWLQEELVAALEVLTTAGQG